MIRGGSWLVRCVRPNGLYPYPYPSPSWSLVEKDELAAPPTERPDPLPTEAAADERPLLSSSSSPPPRSVFLLPPPVFIAPITPIAPMASLPPRLALLRTTLPEFLEALLALDFVDGFCDPSALLGAGMCKKPRSHITTARSVSQAAL